MGAAARCRAPRRDHAVRQQRGRRNQTAGLWAEDIACGALRQDGWQILGRRVRTEAGEIDAIAQRDGLLAVIEVKQRATLGAAAMALGRRQQDRLTAAAAVILAENPGWGLAGVRFDLVLVDREGAVRRIADAFRECGLAA